ncbi:MAG: 50S ribosomal protein L28 [Patescibacteria group bacterium]|nr:MAG: 50S ribosomal protein L28 [Patescibacteria group bacterium]
MATQCQLTGSKASSGFNKSHSNRRTKRRFKPNLQTKKVVNPKTGLTHTLTLSARAIKTLKKWDKEGLAYDLEEVAAKK